MSKFCTECGTVINEGKKFCTGCGTAVTEPPAAVTPEQAAEQPPPRHEQQSQQTQTTQQTQPYIQPAHYQQPQPQNGQSAPETTPVSPLKFWRWLFVMTLPLAGLVVSILWGRNKEPSARRSLARAMIFYAAVWLVICAAFAVTLNLFLQAKDLVDIGFKLFGIKLF